MIFARFTIFLFFYVRKTIFVENLQKASRLTHTSLSGPIYRGLGTVLGLIIVLTEALLEKLSLCGVDTGLPSRQRGAEPIFRDPVIITFGPK